MATPVKKPKKKAKAVEPTSARESAASESAAPAGSRPKKFRVRIRMYRQGIGDSFLLTFPTPRGLVHILIDCGVVMGTADAEKWTQRIANDVTSEAKPEAELKAIVGTHPHWDHLSGFLTANWPLPQAPKPEIWMAWTEDPNDPEGRSKQNQHLAQMAGVRMAVASLAATLEPSTRAQAAATNELLSFYGPDDGQVGLPAADAKTTAAASAALRGLGTAAAYWNPGDIISPTWLPGVRIYVLGPPRDEKLLGKMLSNTPGDMYALGSNAGFVSALAANAGADLGALGLSSSLSASPFESSYLFPRDKASTYGLVGEIAKRYADPTETWRTIDDQWLLSAETLALQLDNAINNLSLVLAFEFVESKDVLLFAADAQLGNWLSWRQLKNWKVKEADGTERDFNAKDLLSRAVFYKVGHHASHNATLQNGGLEDMSHPGLVAAIAVDETFANGVKRWPMPAPALYKRLLERTEGRVMRSDGIGPFAVGPGTTITPNDAGKAFCSSVFQHPTDPTLSIDYYLP